MSNRKILKTVWDYVVITLACMFYCSAWTQVFMPNGIASGGITGLCTIIQYGTGFPMYISYGIINAVLLVLAFLILGRTFGIRTIYAMAAITLFMDILPMLDLPVLVLKEGNGLLVPVIASLMEAFSIAIMINYGSSSGGTDIIALILNKYLPVSLGQVYVATDLVIIASILLIPGKTIDDMLYGYLAVIVFSLGLDYLMLGRKSSVQMIVFSDHYAEIADYINKKLDRGVTALNAIGWYSQKDKKVLLILVRRSEMPQITDKIKKVDPRAFVAVTPVSSVYGEGFEEIKTSLKLKRKNDEQDN